MANHLQIKLMGGFEVLHHGIPYSDFRTAKIRALLVYLAVENGRPHLRQFLAELLWPDMPTRNALKNLRVSLSRLRCSLNGSAPGAGEPWLITSRQIVQLEETSVQVDALEILALFAGCESHEHQELAHCDACLERLLEAYARYHGEFLVGFSAGETPGFDDWMFVWREKLQEKILLILYHLSTAFEARGKLNQALEYAQALHALDAYYEPGYRQVMRILVESGRRGEAIMAFERCRTFLLDQLGVEPSPRTIALYEKIRNE